MLSKKIIHILLLMLLVSSAVSIPFQVVQADPFVLTDDDPVTHWDDTWTFHQKINPPIQTHADLAKYQPIDITIQFDSLCWAINETVHSVRICTWDTQRWHELESQIYDLNFTDDTHIASCRVVFLIPMFADGKESYYVYYNKDEIEAPSYTDHVSVKDAYYYFEPISGISVEGDYYEIQQDGEIAYGIGQKGKVMNRYLSQAAISMKPGTTTFDILNSDVLASFAFSYQAGKEDEDEIASDQRLIAKDIIIDGTLMLKVMVASESLDKTLRSTNVYTYYYNPIDMKRINVHVNHEVFDDLTVSGIENADGRYGAIISYHSKSSSMKKMVFGEILPYLHIYGKDGRIQEYSMITNPQSSTREWMISYEDNCDLGDQAWIAYSQGVRGRTHAMIFSSNENIISNASMERDGLEVKVAAKEYLNFVGAEIDYASITFGRNAFEPLQPHKLSIQKGLIVEFDVEFITFQNATYESVQDESIFYQTLIKQRDTGSQDASGNQAIYTLTIIPHLFGRILSFPLIRNMTGLSLPILCAEVYHDNILVASAKVEKQFIGFQVLKIPKLIAGSYTVRLYRLYGDETKRYIGVGQTRIENDTTVHIYCTWEKSFFIDVTNQYNKPLENVTLQLYQGSLLVAELMTGNMTNYTLAAPFNLFESYEIKDIKNITFQEIFKLAKPYELIGYYKGFRICNITISLFQRRSQVTINVYDLIVEITDELNLPPDVNVKPWVTSDEMKIPMLITPTYLGFGRYQFSNLPKALYTLQISYRGYEKKKTVDVPACGELISIRFAFTSPISFRLLTIRGEPVSSNDAQITVKRDGQMIASGIQPDGSIDLPPGSYTVNVFEQNTLIGSKKIQVSHATTIDIVTTIPSLVVIILSLGAILLFSCIIILFMFGHASLNTSLKLLVLILVILSLIQPWWSLSAETTDGSATKKSEMYLYPHTMIEEYTYKDHRYIDLSTIPEMFTQFLQVLLYVIYAGIGLLLISFIPNIFLRKRFSLLLVTVSIVFVSIVAVAFTIGMSKIAEISLGVLQGSNILSISLPFGEMVYMNGQWGLGTGFYLIVCAAAIAIIAGIYDTLRKYVYKQRHKEKHL